MSMTKRIIAVMVAAMMIMAMGVCTVSASAVVDKFEVIEFSVLNAAGTDADTIGAGKTVTVRTTLKRVEGVNNTDVEANVITAVYSGSELVDVAGSTKNYYNYGTVQVNDAVLTIPAGKTNLTFKAFLWDDDMITPLAKSSDEAEITGITIGGVEVADFDADVTSYDVSLPVGTDAEPTVYVEANGITNADVTYADGVATIATINGEYTINYTISPAEVTNAVYSYSDGVALTKRGVLRTPSDAIMNAAADDTLATAIDAGLGSLPEHAALAWTDRNASIYWELPEEVIGKEYIPVKYYSATGNYASSNYTTFTLTVNADARIYFTGMAWNNRNTVTYLGADGAVDGGDDVAVTGVTQINGTVSTMHIDDIGFNTVTIGQMKAADSSYHKTTTKVFWKADLILPDGVETATYLITCACDAFVPVTVAYEFLSSDGAAAPALDVSATMLHGATGAETRVPVGGSAKLPTYVYDEANGNYQIGVTLDDTAATIYADSASRLNAHDYHIITDCPEEMLGAMSTTWNDNTYGTNKDIGSVDVTITINRDATIYLDTTDEFAAKAGAVAIAPLKTITVGNSYSAIEGKTFETNDSTGSDYHGGRLFKIDLDVPEGASSATFKIPVAYWYSDYPFFFIK